MLSMSDVVHEYKTGNVPDIVYVSPVDKVKQMLAKIDYLTI